MERPACITDEYIQAGLRDLKRKGLGHCNILLVNYVDEVDGFDSFHIPIKTYRVKVTEKMWLEA